MDQLHKPESSSREGGIRRPSFTERAYCSPSQSESLPPIRRERKLSTSDISIISGISGIGSICSIQHDIGTREDNISSDITERQVAPKSDSTPIEKIGTRNSGDARSSEASPEALSQKIGANIASVGPLLERTESELSAVLTDMEKASKKALENINSFKRHFTFLGGKQKDAALNKLREYASMSELLVKFGKLCDEARWRITKLDGTPPLGLEIQSFNEYVNVFPVVKRHVKEQRGKFVTNYCRDYRQFNEQTTEAPERNYYNDAVKGLQELNRKLETITINYSESRKEKVEKFQVADDNQGQYGPEVSIVNNYLKNVNAAKEGRKITDSKKLDKKAKGGIMHSINQIKISQVIAKTHDDTLIRKMAYMVLKREIKKLDEWVSPNLGIQLPEGIL